MKAVILVVSILVNTIAVLYTFRLPKNDELTMTRDKKYGLRPCAIWCLPSLSTFLIIAPLQRLQGIQVIPTCLLMSAWCDTPQPIFALFCTMKYYTPVKSKLCLPNSLLYHPFCPLHTKPLFNSCHMSHLSPLCKRFSILLYCTI